MSAEVLSVQSVSSVVYILVGHQKKILMKAYLITTGTVFGLITVAHVARFFAEGSRLLTEPLFLLLTVLAASLCIWAWTLLKRLARPS